MNRPGSAKNTIKQPFYSAPFCKGYNNRLIYDHGERYADETLNSLSYNGGNGHGRGGGSGGFGGSGNGGSGNGGSGNGGSGNGGSVNGGQGNGGPGNGGQGNGGPGMGNTGTSDVSQQNADSSSSEVKLKDDPRFSKYLKMVKVGLPKTAVADKMAQEGVVASMEDGLKLLELDPEAPVPPSAVLKRSKSKEDSDEAGHVPINEHPAYSKYFKMLKVGLSKETVQAKMRQEGVDPEILDKILPTRYRSKEKKDHGGEKVPIRDHPMYMKYFKMLKVGLPKDAVKAKMQQEGADSSMLDKDPEELIPLHPPKAEDDSPKVKLSEHPTYSKYFKMLKVGLPKDAVRAKMRQRSVDPDMLDKNPDDLVSLNPKSSESNGPKVPANEHPKYAKYFKMLKVGLQKEAVKAKMKQEGVDPDILDKEPSSLIPLEEKGSDGPKVAVQDHPQLAKYFKMLKVGLPKDTVKGKMQQENIDPKYIDMEPASMIQVDLTKEASVEKRNLHPSQEKLHWKALTR